MINLWDFLRQPPDGLDSIPSRSFSASFEAEVAASVRRTLRRIGLRDDEVDTAVLVGSGGGATIEAVVQAAGTPTS